MIMHIFKKKEESVDNEAEEKKVKSLEGELIDLSVKESERRRHEELLMQEKSLKSQLGRAKFLSRHPSIQKLGSGAKEFGRFVVEEQIPAMRRGASETMRFVSKEGIPAMREIYGLKTAKKSKKEFDDVPTDAQIRKELRSV